jgi:hypothetical protein
MKHLDPAPTLKWGTRLALIGKMLNRLSGPERNVLEAQVLRCMKADQIPDLVRALRRADRKRFAAALANHPTRR